MRTHADYAAVVEVLGGILADIGDVGSEFLHAALCLAHFESVLIDMH